MSTTATSSQATDIQVSISSTFTTIPGVKGFTLPIGVPDFDEISNLDSTAKEWLPTLDDGGTVAFDMVLDINTPNAAQLYLQTARQNKSLEAFKVNPSNGGTGMAHYTFSAYIAKYELKMQTAKAKLVGVELRITGPVSAS